jgi:ribonucleoside-diphosphate reductase alpha chain
MAYDSPEGRNTAAGITALMCGEAYRTSARIARRMGPYEGFADDRDAMLNVLDMHRDAAASLDRSKLDDELADAIDDLKEQLTWVEKMIASTQHANSAA